MHDGMHFALSTSPFVNVACAYLGSAHMSISGWTQQHVVGHHCHTNLANADPDLYHFSFLAHSGIPGFRTSKAQRPVDGGPWYWRLGLCIRVPMTTCGPSLLWDWANWTVFKQSFLGMVPHTPPFNGARLTLHMVGRVALLAFCIVYPLVWFSAMGVREAHIVLHAPAHADSGLGEAHMSSMGQARERELIILRASQLICGGILKGMLFAILPYAIHGVIFYVFSQVSHIQEPCLETIESEVERRAKYRDEHTGTAQRQADADGPLRKAAHGGAQGSKKGGVVPPGAAPEGGPRRKISAEEKTAAEHDWLDELERNHLQEEAPANPVKLSRCARQEWAVHQLRSTLDYSCESVFWSYISNGLNNQGVHHLFPMVDWSHYSALEPIIRKVANKHGLDLDSSHRQPGLLR